MLAWIRTAIALMGFGFVVARFGIFLREITAVENPGLLRSGGLSVWFGTGLVMFGVTVSVIAARQYRREILELNRDAAIGRNASSLAILTGLGLVVIGVLMAGYLIAISGYSTPRIMAK